MNCYYCGKVGLFPIISSEKTDCEIAYSKSSKIRKTDGNENDIMTANKEGEEYLIKKMKQLHITENQEGFVNFGNGEIKPLTSLNIPEQGNSYLERHYPDFLKSDGNFGQIFIPPTFVTGHHDTADIEDVEKKLKALEETNNQMILKTYEGQQETELNKKKKTDSYEKRLRDLKQTKDELIEKRIYENLKCIFAEVKVNAIIFHSHDLLQLKTSNMSGEHDFVIILDTGVVINIECKKTLNKGDAYQLKKFREFLSLCLSSHIESFTKEDWRVISMFHCKKANEKEICVECRQYISVGYSNFEETFKSVLLEHTNKSTKNFDDIKYIFKHMILSHAIEKSLTPQYHIKKIKALVEKQREKSLTPQYHIKKIKALVEKQSAPKNIVFFSFWTPEQLGLMNSNVNKVVFSSIWGTGKTTLLFHKAQEIAKKSSHPVLLFICYEIRMMETLFAMETKIKFEGMKNLEVISITQDDALDKIEGEVDKYCGKCHVFVDELNATPWSHIKTIKSSEEGNFLWNLKNISSKLDYHFFWIVMSGVKKLWVTSEFFSNMEKRCPEDYFIDRSTHCVYPGPFQLRIPSNIAEGVSSQLRVIKENTLEESFEKAVGEFNGIEEILIIIDQVTVFDYCIEIMKKIKRSAKCLVWGSIFEHKDYGKVSRSKDPDNSEKQEIKAWLKGDINCPLLATMNVCAGFEYPYVIHVNSGTTDGWRRNIWARCIAHLVVIDWTECFNKNPSTRIFKMKS